MLFFLRKIRHKLMEKNKVTTYLLYAIGEIILVVIGILIAVSVNEMRQQKGNDKLADTYTQSLIADLKADSAIYQNRLLRNNQLIRHLDSANIFISDPNTTKEALIQFAKERYDIAILGYWGVETSTLQSLISTGKYELYSLEIRNQITELNRINNEIKLFSGDGIKWALNTLRDHENRYLRGKVNNLMKPNDQLIAAAWDGINEREFIASFINLMNTKYVIISGYQAGLQRQLDATSDLIRSLENMK